MKIVRTKQYRNALQNIMQFIAKDSREKALRFRKQLDTHIGDLPLFPYKFRQSIYFEEKNIRDLIFKGYTIPYKIEEERIIILGIKKYTQDF
jgi:plasmid stabilization system protein ParE